MLWLVRHSMFGLDEIAIKRNMIFFQWFELPDLTKYDTKAKMKGVFEKKLPDNGPRSISTSYGQMWSFIRRIKIGDHVVLTRELSSKVALGEVTGEYHYDRNIPGGPWHCRSVRWIERDIPRSRLPADIRQSLNAQLTVCKIDRDRAEERLLKSIRNMDTETNVEQVTEEMMESAIDPEKQASDRILAYIGENFRSHGFEKLVGEILRAKGYTVNVTGRGPDGGVDILAGRGDLGFDSPSIAVQVKSSDSSVDSSVIEKLNADLERFGAEKGLVVAWGGFIDKSSIERRREFFRIRLWDDTDLFRELLENYEKFSPEWKNRIPLKRIWALVDTEKGTRPATML